MRDPFAEIPIELFDRGTREYPAVGKLFDKRIKRLINKGLNFFELPRIYQWMIVPSHIARLKLRTLDSALAFLSGIDGKLDKKIREIANLESDPEMFRLFTELLVTYRILHFGLNKFVYEEPLEGSLAKFDINLDFRARRIRIDVTHKEDVYPLEATAERIRTNLQYANPECGGHIEYSPPSQQSYRDGTTTFSEDMTETQVKETILHAMCVMETLASGSANVHCESPFFQITLHCDSAVWTGGSGGTWNGPNINGHVTSIQKKAEKSNNVADGSYKIIAVDLIPGSDFHRDSPYRDQLKRQLMQSALITSSTIDEIVSFSMRFENGEFENVDILWIRDPSLQPILMQLVQ